MPLRSFPQNSWFAPLNVAPNCLETGTLAWLLANYTSLVLPDWLFVGWRGEGRRGRNAWPAPILAKLLLLRWNGEGMSRLGSTKVARHNVEWRAAMGLEVGGATPSEKTLREFEKFLQGHHPEIGQARYRLFHEHIVRVCTASGLGGKDAVWGTDSTPMWCYGAVRGTIRLLGDGLRRLIRLWARARDKTVEEIAQRWELLKLAQGKSAKGSFDVNWKDPNSRATVLEELVRGVNAASKDIRKEIGDARASKRRKLLKCCRHLLKVVAQDVRADEAGRLTLPFKKVGKRIASLTDPEARHGRKSSSKTYTGFKLHVLGDCVSGLITSLTVTHGSQHDSTVTPRLVRRAAALLSGFERLLADTAYGAAELRHKLEFEHGIKVLAPPPPTSKPRNSRFSRGDFSIDFDSLTATCPNETSTRDFRPFNIKTHEKPAIRFYWNRDDCTGCPFAKSCLEKGRRTKSLKLHPYEKELRQAREDWQDPHVRKAYRQRSQHERLINRLTRHGARKARAFGLFYANLQSHKIAMACNLTLLAKRLAQEVQTTA